MDEEGREMEGRELKEGAINGNLPSIVKLWIRHMIMIIYLFRRQSMRKIAELTSAKE
jgi:hypothetical protein